MELLAPAGGMEALIAAVRNGADAVYLGFGDYNARRNAGNFTEEEFAQAVDFCHERGVRVHVTLNTLVRQDELYGVTRAVETCAERGADAIIVQDMGVARLAKHVCPTLPVHASTQLAIANAAGAEYALHNGFDRAVLARECSLDEIRRCRATGIEIETFVHGALCVCLSGQCLMSSMIGGRSGNRGLCAQPCRLPYALAKRGATARADKEYLLSTRDIMRIDDLVGLRDAGVTSLKIEGRLKRPEYVAVVTRAYRTALDALGTGESVNMPELKRELAQIFNRGGFTDGYLSERFRDSDVVDHERPNNRGVLAGEILSARGTQVRLRTYAELHTGDQLALRSDDGETGFELQNDIPKGDSSAVLPKSPAQGDKIFRAADARQLAQARESCRSEYRLSHLTASVRLITGEPSEMRITGEYGEVRVTGEEVQSARSQPLTREKAAQSLGKLGDAPYIFDRLDINMSENAFMAVSALNALRRDALTAYRNRVIELRRGCKRPTRAEIRPTMATARTDAITPRICVQSSDVSDAVLGDCFYWQPDRIDEASLTAELARIPESARLYLRLPQMANTPELDALVRFVNANASRFAGTVLTNISHLGLTLPGEKVSGPELYAWNAESVNALRVSGVSRICAPLELTSGELSPLTNDGEWELFIYGRATLMTLRHCPVCAVNGTRHADCRLCDNGTGARFMQLIDRKDCAFPMDGYCGESGCYVQVLNSAPHQLLTHIKRLPRAAYWRIAFTDEPRIQRERIVSSAYAAASGREFDASIFPSSTTTGHYFRGVD